MNKVRFLLKILGLMCLACVLMTASFVLLTIGAAFMANGTETIFNIFHVHSIGGML